MELSVFIIQEAKAMNQQERISNAFECKKGINYLPLGVNVTIKLRKETYF